MLDTKIPLTKPESFSSIQELNNVLRWHGCNICDLGKQKDLKGVCISRGNLYSERMIVGEGPGEDEDETGIPFKGKAGQLLDRIFASVDLDTNDFYLTNAILCRKIAPRGSGRKNLTPDPSEVDSCSSWLQEQIRLINPRLIVVVGGIAAKALINKNAKITKISGTVIEKNERIFFPILHPAAILHMSWNKQKQQQMKLKMWDDVKHLKQLMIEKGL